MTPNGHTSITINNLDDFLARLQDIMPAGQAAVISGGLCWIEQTPEGKPYLVGSPTTEVVATESDIFEWAPFDREHGLEICQECEAWCAKPLLSFRPRIIVGELSHEVSPQEKSVPILLNHFDDDCIVVDSSTMELKESSISDIIDHAAQLILVMRTTANRGISDQEVEEVCQELESALVVAGVIEDYLATPTERPAGSYLVGWRIDVEADTPRDAAVYARNLQLKHDSTALVFDVQDSSGHTVTIDLEESPDDSDE